MCKCRECFGFAEAIFEATGRFYAGLDRAPGHQPLPVERPKPVQAVRKPREIPQPWHVRPARKRAA